MCIRDQTKQNGLKLTSGKLLFVTINNVLYILGHGKARFPILKK
jgi:hypothetical protein